jgi:decaprenylphospho-beta-D-erythro-pentofuranosid-2-ulose 2-reductase
MKDALGAVQSVLVLGGTSEIGVATARALVRGRARTVVLAARDPEACAEAAATLRADGAERVEAVKFDAVDFPSHAALIDQVFANGSGDIDLVLVAFGVLGEEEDPVGVLQVNTVGAASVMAEVARRMTEQGHGTIVLLSSVAGERVRKSNFMYGSSKAGADGFAQGLADSLAGTGVSVMVVRPGFVKTKMTAGLDPVPFSTTPEAVAEAIVRGLARGSDVVWVPGVLRGVMSVLRHVPRPIFRRLPL